MTWLLVLLPVVGWAAAAAVLWPGPFDPMLEPWLLASIAFWIAGTTLVLKVPASPIGRMMLCYPFLAAFGLIGVVVATTWRIGTERAVWAETIALAFATPSLLPLPLTLLYFPDGRLPSPRWRVGPALIGGAVVTGFLAALLNGGWGGDRDPNVPDSPLRAATAPWGDVVSWLFFGLMMAAFVVAGASLVRRFMRSEGIERNQLKWVMYSGALVAVLVLLLVGYSLALLDGLPGDLVLIAGMQTIPAAIAIAVLRYRLYDIDRLVSRTVSYALLALMIAGVYAIGAVWLPSQLFGSQPPVFVAGSTLAAAALFNPLRGRVTRWVDRRFYRSRYDAERVAEAFSSQLRHQVDVDLLTADWLAVVTTTMRPTAATVWVRDSERR